jgi:hypothetical protein
MPRMNRRARRAQDALNGGNYHEGSTDDPTAVVDLLSDLRHFCDARGLDFGRAALEATKEGA